MVKVQVARLGAHTRRPTPRGFPWFDNQRCVWYARGNGLNRRRILRRGLPYEWFEWHKKDNEVKHGTIFMVINASIEKVNFEFVQQQWD